MRLRSNILKRRGNLEPQFKNLIPWWTHNGGKIEPETAEESTAQQAVDEEVMSSKFNIEHARSERQGDGANDTDTLLPHVNPAASAKETGNKSDKSTFAAIASCALYSLCSVAMVLTNKGISSSVPAHIRGDLPKLTIIMVQCLIAIVFVEIARLAKFIDYPSFNWTHAKSMLPLNIIFIGMLFSGFLSLVYVSVPIVTVFKNLTNIATVAGDWYFFKEK